MFAFVISVDNAYSNGNEISVVLIRSGTVNGTDTSLILMNKIVKFLLHM